jgi:tetratricopeptide (TPR) repeat protein
LNKKKFIQIVAVFAATILNSKICEAVSSADTKPKKAGSTIGRARVRLTRNSNSFSVIVNQEGKPQESGDLLSINSIMLKGKSEREIYRMLAGPVNSTIEIVYLDYQNESHTTKVECEPLQKAGEPALADLTEAISELDDGRTEWSLTSEQRAENYEAQNLDLLTQAYLNSAREEAENLPGPKSLAIGPTAAKSIATSDRLGDMKLADHFLQLVLQNPKFDWRIGDMEESDSEKLVDHLVLTGRFKEAETFCKILFAQIEAEKKNKSSIYANPQRSKQAINEMLVNVYIAEHSKKEGLEVARQLVAVGENKSWDWRTRNGKNWLAEAFELLGDNEKAEECYQQWLHSDELKTDHSERYLVRNYCDDAYHLAKLLQRSGKSTKAIETLENALSQYNKHLTSEQKLLNEQMVEFFPVGSDLEIELASCYLADRKFDLAQETASAAINRIETAIGPRSRQLKPALQISLETLQATGKNTDETKKRLLNLEHSLSEQEASDTEQFGNLRAALNAIGNGNKAESRKLIDNLVSILDFRTADRVKS